MASCGLVIVIMTRALGFITTPDHLPKLREIFLDFSSSFLLLSFPSMLFWDKEKTKEGQDQTKLFRLTKMHGHSGQL